MEHVNSLLVASVDFSVIEFLSEDNSLIKECRLEDQWNFTGETSRSIASHAIKNQTLRLTKKN